MVNNGTDKFIVPQGEDRSRWFLFTVAKLLGDETNSFSNISLHFAPLSLTYIDLLTNDSIKVMFNSLYPSPFDAIQNDDTGDHSEY